MKVKIKHVDGITDVMANVWICHDDVSLDYRFEGLTDSLLVEKSCYKKGDYYEGRKIVSVYTLDLEINPQGVITWRLYGSKYPHKTRWANGDIKEIHDYYYCRTRHYPDMKFKDFSEHTHKTIEYRIAENCGYESPRAFADYLIDTYKVGFTGQIISFKKIEY